MRSFALIGIVLCSGCVTTSQIVPVGKDTYIVTSSNDACNNCNAPPQVLAAKAANEYCAKLSKAMLARSYSDSKFDIGFGTKTTLTFSCLDPASGEYKNAPVVAPKVD